MSSFHGMFSAGALAGSLSAAWLINAGVAPLAQAVAVAALGYGAFSITMAIGRFTGDRVNHRIGPVPLTRYGATAGALGLGLGLVAQTPTVMIAGFALMGLGLSNVVPVIFTASAAAGETQAEGTSGAATLGYLGFLAGPL